MSYQSQERKRLIKYARKAWQVFQETEAAGGIVAGLRDGSVAARLAASADAARTRLATRKDALTGVSECVVTRDVVVSRGRPQLVREKKAS